ncbi:MAG: hypothetical protein V7645_2749 [Actinomycetota bacterium]
MSWCWFALLDAPADDTTAQAAVAGGGWLAAWQRRAKPVRHARRIDARIIDRDGDAAAVSLVITPAGIRLPFDDLAVQQARRAVLAGVPADAVSTLLSDASHFEGSVTVMRGRVVDDPFARVFPARLLHVEAGLFGRVPPPCGPTIERYGSAQPWPWDRYELS